MLLDQFRWKSRYSGLLDRVEKLLGTGVQAGTHIFTQVAEEADQTTASSTRCT